MSQILRFNFKVMTEAGKNWIVLEPVEERSNVLAGVSLSFNLPEGATSNQAEEIAAYLNENIKSVTYTAT